MLVARRKMWGAPDIDGLSTSPCSGHCGILGGLVGCIPAVASSTTRVASNAKCHVGRLCYLLGIARSRKGTWLGRVLLPRTSGVHVENI